MCNGACVNGVCVMCYGLGLWARACVLAMI